MPDPTPPTIETDQDWADREAYWRGKLRRLRFGAEPLSVQVERHRRTTIALTVVASVVAAMFLMIFSAFRRPEIAVVIIGVLLAPIVGLAWFDFRTLRGRVDAYEVEKKKAPSSGPGLA